MEIYKTLINEVKLWWTDDSINKTFPKVYPMISWPFPWYGVG